MARFKQSSGKKSSSPRSNDASAEIVKAGASRGHTDPQWASGRTIVIAALVAAVIVAAIGAGFYLVNGGKSTWDERDASAATFVGSETCAGCHQAEAKLWHGSHHQQAMDHATEKSVLGDFNDASFDYYGVHSRFFRKDGKFLVETDGPDGKLATFEVKYTFGVYPLQQYLIEFPDGRIQALSIAWDSRPKEQGGQRWFHLYPNEEIKHDDILHWTKLNQNWNFMCAECHSTGVQKNYDAANDRYHTHGRKLASAARPATAKARAMLPGHATSRAGGRSESMRISPKGSRCASTSAAMSPGATIRRPATRSAMSLRPLLRKEVETCGLCHARRGEFSEDWVPGQWLSDTHVVSGSATDSITPTGKCRTKSTITARSSRARCLRQASPAAIATTRTATNLEHPATASVCSAMRRTNTPPQLTATMKPSSRRSAALVSYADPHLHGRRSAPRSQFASSATGPVGEIRHAQCLQRLPHGQIG